MDKVNKQTDVLKKLKDSLKGEIMTLDRIDNEDFKKKIRIDIANLESQIQSLQSTVDERKNLIYEKEDFENARQRILQEKERIENDRAMTETMYENNLQKVQDYQEDIAKYTARIKDEDDAKKYLQEERKKLAEERAAYINKFEPEDVDTFNWDKVKDYNSVIENYDKNIDERDKQISKWNRSIEQANRFMESPQNAVEMYGSYLDMLKEQAGNADKRLAQLEAQSNYEATVQKIRENEAETDKAIENLRETRDNISNSTNEELRNTRKNKYAAEYIAAVEPELKAEAKEVAEAVKVKAEERMQRRAAEAEVKAQAKAVAEAAKAKAQEKAQAKAEAKAAAAEKAQFKEYKERLNSSSARVNLSDKEISGIVAFKNGLENSLAGFQKDLDRSLAAAKSSVQRDMTKVKSTVNSVISVVEDMEQNFRGELDKDKKILRDKQRLAKETRERNRREIEKLEKMRDVLIEEKGKTGIGLLNAHKNTVEEQNKVNSKSSRFTFALNRAQNKEAKLDKEYKEINTKLEKINDQVSQMKQEMRETAVDAANQSVKNQEKERIINSVLNPVKDKINAINMAISEKLNQKKDKQAEANENSVEKSLDEIMEQRGFSLQNQNKTSAYNQKKTPSMQRQMT
ncbi:MAG: hypothetical protein LUC92_04900 [Clostridiales bacterium]|nr:hypothetical protein [Clostridiales bacterium]